MGFLACSSSSGSLEFHDDSEAALSPKWVSTMLCVSPSVGIHPVTSTESGRPPRVRGAAFFLCRSCYLSRRDIIASTMTPPHLMNERRRGMSSESDDQG